MTVRIRRTTIEAAACGFLSPLPFAGEAAAAGEGSESYRKSAVTTPALSRKRERG
jgi:hypothetical protein